MEDIWYPKAKVVLSPFCDERDDPNDVSLLVLHNISLPPGQFENGHIEAFFQGKLDGSSHPYLALVSKMKVSAHCLITRSGNIIQFVPFNKRAWHAGLSSFAGREKCNDFSIGIELEGTDTQSFTEQQYQSLSRLTKFITDIYPAITSHRITGHQYIAAYRKSDPGLCFDWRYFRRLQKHS